MAKLRCFITARKAMAHSIDRLILSVVPPAPEDLEWLRQEVPDLVIGELVTATGLCT
jgi:hypothetical protein